MCWSLIIITSYNSSFTLVFCIWCCRKKVIKDTLNLEYTCYKYPWVSTNNILKKCQIFLFLYFLQSWYISCYKWGSWECTPEVWTTAIQSIFWASNSPRAIISRDFYPTHTYTRPTTCYSWLSTQLSSTKKMFFYWNKCTSAKWTYLCGMLKSC